VEGSVVLEAESFACVMDAAMGRGGHPASVDAHNLQGVVNCRNQVQGEAADQAVASSAAVADAVLVLEEVLQVQDGTEALGRGLVKKREDGWQS